MPTYTSTDQNGDVLLALTVPEAEYMYGCTPTAIAMVLGYYDLHGYRGADLSNMIEGDVDSKSRGTDGNAYNMNAFDTALGRAIATESFVSRFHSRGGKETTPSQELKYAFKSDNKTMNTDYWDCIADYLGTGQYWRGNDNLATTISYTSLEDVYKNESILEITAGSIKRNVPHVDIDMLHGLELYVQSRGYEMDYEITGSYVVDVAGGSFTFEDYMYEIDSGRPVMISISGHSMVGYGYNADSQEIIFDDCYVSGRRMAWNGTYRFDKTDRPLQAITVIGINVNGSVDLALENVGGSDWKKIIAAGATGAQEDADYCFAEDTVRLSFTVSNLGTKDSGEFGVSFLVDGTRVGTETLDSVSGESARTMTDIPLGELTVGLHNVQVILDESNDVQELSGSNNTGKTDILVLKTGTTVVTSSHMRAVDSKESVNDIYVQGGANLTVRDGKVFGAVLRGLVTASSSKSINWVPGEIIVSEGGYVSGTAVYAYGEFNVSSGGSAADTHIFSRGSAVVRNGGTASDAVIESGGKVVVETGGSLTGLIRIEEGASARFSGGALNFDLASLAPGETARVNNLSRVVGTPVYTLTVSGTQAHGTYRLAEEVASFKKTISVRDTKGTVLGTVSVGTTAYLNGSDYKLKLEDKSLTLTVSEHVPVDSVAPTVSDIKASITEPTCLAVVVTAEFGDDVELASKLYRIGESGEWLEYTDGVTVTKNATVYFKAVDTSDNESVIASCNVSNITSSGCVLFEGQTANVLPGRALTETVLSGGSMFISSDGMAVGTRVDEAGRMVVSSGGTATGTTVNREGSVSVLSGGVADGVIAADGGRVVVYDSGTMTGQMTFAPDADITFSAGSILDFDLSSLKPGAEERLNDLSRIRGTPLFSLTVSARQAKGLYRLADGAADFESEVSVRRNASDPPLGLLAVGQTVDINGAGYSLNLSDNVLTLTIGAAGTANHADCGWNNKLCDNKTPNPKVKDAVPAALTLDVPEILLDSEGSVKGDRHNFVGFGDEADFTKITLDHAAKLSFRIDATDAVKFVIYRLDDGKDDTYTMKSLQVTAFSKRNGFGGTTGALLLEGGDYYLSMQSTNAKKGGSAYYSLFLNTEGDNASYIFADGDLGMYTPDNSNNWLYDSKKKIVNPRATSTENPFSTFEITESVTKAAFQIDENEMTLNDLYPSYTNFVGWGDTIDFAKLSATQPVKLNIDVVGSENVKLKVYSLTKNATGKWTLKTLQTTTFNVKKPTTTGFGKDLYLDRLIASTGAEATGYYVSVESTNKKGNAYYNVSVTSKVYSDSDFGVNGVLLVDKYTINDKLQKDNEIMGKQTKIATEVHIPDVDDIDVEARTIGDKTYENFVGLGDEWDYAEVQITQGGKLKLELDVTGTAKQTSKLVLYKLTLKANGTWSKSTVGTLSVKTSTQIGENYVGYGSKFITIKDNAITKVTGQAGDIRYFVGVQAGNARKGTESYYTAYATLEGKQSASLSMPETDDLGIADALNTDALADASSFGLASEKILEDSGKGILASL